jgi:hypothetical protein
VHTVASLAGLSELSDVRMLWFSDWYDGPVTGLAAHDGREYWFVMVPNDGGEAWDFDPRVYVLHQLTAEQLADEWERHRAFAALDIPGCLHTPGCRVASIIKTGERERLYERWPADDEAGHVHSPPVGWFRETKAA